ncbi:hypothetical protein [Clostridium algidicarnis]|uniref:hypothetical protein n=1 Tax=Clostridium algidicarnis TaxID=37659 RepID=UPI001627A147|nr:hypothetical protein [Clostridium algidicarnis]MBB6632463.1 hypothetical protein [Clostridium algidicarnis]MBU3194950.1 hypothetical protein [Clostridium algidicarnis]MBU3197638.1 hypothetical protein [Clostridium algidicarnis]MBU3205354.1 hypothetical protein [Clostridium algidicarnis]MBU3213500.1 hypothetical protein [Clostridium algidicarnis]
MSDYKLDISGYLGLNEYSNINDYMDIVEISDKFTISLEENNKSETGIICAMLKEKGFNINKSEIRDDNKVYIFANKINN